MAKEISAAKLNTEQFITEKVREIRKIVGKGIAINALSGGVDSSVVTALGYRALGDRLKACFIDGRARCAGRGGHGGAGAARRLGGEKPRPRPEFCVLPFQLHGHGRRRGGAGTLRRGYPDLRPRRQTARAVPPAGLPCHRGRARGVLVVPEIPLLPQAGLAGRRLSRGAPGAAERDRHDPHPSGAGGVQALSGPRQRPTARRNPVPAGSAPSRRRGAP